MRPWVRGAVGVVAASFVLGSCGDAGGGDGAGGSDAAIAADGAVLGVLEAGVDVADEPVDPVTAQFRAGQDGEPLVVRDVIRTDPSGFAEVTWFEGALARVDADSTYTLTTFDATPGRAVVVTELDSGRIWNRLREGAVSTYEIDTDVGTAAVRGTAFWVACGAGQCTFAVLEGHVVIEAADGSRVELAAGEQVTIGEDGTPQGVLRTDPTDEWVLRNDALDSAQGFTALGAGPDQPAAADVLSTSDLDCPLAAPSGWVEQASPSIAAFRDRPCRFVLPNAEVGQFAAVEFSGFDSADGRQALLATARAAHDETRARVGDQACADGSREMFTTIDETIGDGSLFGFWWRVTIGPVPEGSDESCLGGQGTFRYFVVADGVAFDLHVEFASINVFMDEVCSGQDIQSGAYADCVFAEHDRIDTEASALAAELLRG